MDADYYLETIHVVFQDFSLVNGTWDVKNPQGKPERVKPADIKTTALMSVEGELDDISGSGQTQAVHDICTGVPKNDQRHFEAKGAGHYGIFSGRRWRDHVYPQVKAFIAAHQPKAARSAAAPKPVAAASTTATPVNAAAPAAPAVTAKPARTVVARKVAKKVVKKAIEPVDSAGAAPKSVAVKKAVAARRKPAVK
jgi:poly(3-hydroxybutyrate) depolymerase